MNFTKFPWKAELFFKSNQKPMLGALNNFIND